MKSYSSLYIWSSIPPHRAGWYWHRADDSCDGEILRVFKVSDELEWSYQWGDDDEENVDWVCNAHGASWAGPIPEPIEPVKLPEFTD